MMTATARAGESLDALVWRETGRGAAAVQATLAATPGLAADAIALPEGLSVAIPETPATAETVDTVKLWD